MRNPIREAKIILLVTGLVVALLMMLCCGVGSVFGALL